VLPAMWSPHSIHRKLPKELHSRRFPCSQARSQLRGLRARRGRPCREVEEGGFATRHLVRAEPGVGSDAWQDRSNGPRAIRSLRSPSTDVMPGRIGCVTREAQPAGTGRSLYRECRSCRRCRAARFTLRR
jgi:hypothetical protein